MKRIRILFVLCALLPAMANAQVEERQRPAEWEHLVQGGRHMDRFEAMAPSRTARANWGAEAVRERYVDNGIEQDGQQWVNVENFGLSTSQAQTIRVRNKKGEETSVSVPALKPYEEVNLPLK